MKKWLSIMLCTLRCVSLLQAQSGNKDNPMQSLGPCQVSFLVTNLMVYHQRQVQALKYKAFLVLLSTLRNYTDTTNLRKIDRFGQLKVIAATDYSCGPFFLQHQQIQYTSINRFYYVVPGKSKAQPPFLKTNFLPSGKIRY